MENLITLMGKYCSSFLPRSVSNVRHGPLNKKQNEENRFQLSHMIAPIFQIRSPGNDV